MPCLEKDDVGFRERDVHAKIAWTNSGGWQEDWKESNRGDCWTVAIWEVPDAA